MLSLSQDIHFSQVQKAPLYLNSGQTGIYDGDLRLTGLYRSQWYKIDHPFNSMQLSLDSKTNLFGRLIGIGGLFLHDQSSSNYLTVNKMFLSLSHSFFYRNHQFVVGLQPGFTLKSYDNSNITFGSQFDPNSKNFNPDLPSNEYDLSDNMQYFDLNAGIYWRSKIKNLLPSAGVSLQHINRPTETFFSNSDNQRLPIKYSVHGSVEIPLTEKIGIEPLALYTATLTTNELLAGGIVHYFPPNWQETIREISIFSTVRVNPFKNVDALVLGGSINILNIDIGLSYDLNISELRKASNYQGAYEISIVYITNRKRIKKNTEPCYIM